MWQNIVNGILGLWIVALAFLGFSESLHRFLLIITGIFIALIAFGGKHLVKPTEELIKEVEEAGKKLDAEKPPENQPVQDVREDIKTREEIKITDTNTGAKP